MAVNKTDKIYLGRCFSMKTAYGEFKKVSLGPDDLEKINEFAKNNKGWANLLIKNKKTAGPGETNFYVEMDTWVADGKKEKLPF
jgi:hypothetical protein